MYRGKNDQLYGEMEETILACLLVEPSLMQRLRVEEKHFKKFGYILTFFQQFYAKHRNLDVSLMFSVVKGSSEMTLMDAITYLLDVFALPTHFEDYQDRLLAQYKFEKADEWLRKKIYEEATKLFVGDMTTKEFTNEVNKLIKRAEKIEWK